jgi:DNA-binding XRE family transcriptional regulator
VGGKGTADRDRSKHGLPLYLTCKGVRFVIVTVTLPGVVSGEGAKTHLTPSELKPSEPLASNQWIASMQFAGLMWTVSPSTVAVVPRRRNPIDDAGAKALAQTIVRLREERGMTQGDLSRAGDIAHSTLVYVEERHNEPRWGTLRRIARGLGVKLEDLLAEAERLEEEGQHS